jgi:hypothetical protein
MAGQTRAPKGKSRPPRKAATKKTTKAKTTKAKTTTSAGSRPPAKKGGARPAGNGETMEAFVASLNHPREQEILALRRIILAADRSIGEEIKWNAPSFHTSEHFATFQLRAPDGVQVILHRGARPRAVAKAGLAVDDPGALLQWLGPDRASAKFRDLTEIKARRAAFTKIVRQWINYL